MLLLLLKNTAKNDAIQIIDAYNMEGRGAKGKIAQQTRTGYKLPLYFDIQGLCPTHYRL